jgi:integrase
VLINEHKAAESLPIKKIAEVCRSLRWGDFHDRSLYVQRTVLRTRVERTKTVDSEAPVPLVPILQEILTNYRSSLKRYGADDDYIFAGEKRGQSLNLMNVASREIRPKMVEVGMVSGVGWRRTCTPLASSQY